MQDIHWLPERRLSRQGLSGLPEKYIRNHVQLISIRQVVNLDGLISVEAVKKIQCVPLCDLKVVGAQLADLSRCQYRSRGVQFLGSLALG